MRQLRLVFLAGFFYAIHAALVGYVNSSMLHSYVSPRVTSIAFSFGSALSLILVLSIPRVIKRFGTVKIATTLTLLSATVLYFLGTAHTAYTVLPLFVVYFSLNTVIFYCIDIFIEHYSSEGKTGNIRGTSMTINNIAWVSIPTIVGIVTALHGFSVVYLFAAIAMSLVGIIIAVSQKSFVDKVYETPKLTEAFKTIQSSPQLRRILSLNFLLQFFYSWMVLYVPIYLMETMGLDWKTMGWMFSIMLLPFVLLQYPTGKLADRIGEKRLILISLCIAAVATLGFALITGVSPLFIALLLLGTRIGISMFEVLCESYFFKQVTDKDVSIIGLYRTMTPFAYIIGPLVGAGVLFILPYKGLFIILGLLLLTGALYARRLIDTR